MARTLLISIFCEDRTGLVSSITGALFSLGVNLGDTTFAVLGSGAKFTTLCQLPEQLSAEDIERELAALPELKGADITVRRFTLSPTHGPTAQITHKITLRGADQPGLIARLSEVCLAFDANIVRLNSDKMPGDAEAQYMIRISVWIPDERAEACLAAVANTAGALGMDIDWARV
jgi:Glycine cleavage system regulatory protein